MFKKKITGFAFFRIVRSFFCLFFFFFFFLNVGSGLILGLVGLRQYNNFFFGLSSLPMVAELELTDPLLELVFGSVLDLGVSRSKSYIFESSLPCPYWGWGWFLMRRAINYNY